MQTGIEITFPVKKKGRDDICRLMAEYRESDAGRCFILHETNRKLTRKRHTVTEGCLIEDLISGKTFKCVGVTLTEGQSKFPIMQVEPV